MTTANANDVAEMNQTSMELQGDREIVVSRMFNGQAQIIDYVNYVAGLDHSYGSFPNGQPFARQEFYYVTAAATNNGTLPPVVVRYSRR